MRPGVGRSQGASLETDAAKWRTRGYVPVKRLVKNRTTGPEPHRRRTSHPAPFERLPGRRPLEDPLALLEETLHRIRKRGHDPAPLAGQGAEPWTGGALLERGRRAAFDESRGKARQNRGLPGEIGPGD